MAHTILDDWKDPATIDDAGRYCADVSGGALVHGATDPSVAQSGLVSVCMGALTGCFGIWMGKESKTTVTKHSFIF